MYNHRGVSKIYVATIQTQLLYTQYSLTMFKPSSSQLVEHETTQVCALSSESVAFNKVNELKHLHITGSWWAKTHKMPINS